MISEGIDYDTKKTKNIIKDVKVILKGKVLTGFNQKSAFIKSWEMALKGAGIMVRLKPMVELERMKTKWDTQIAGAALFGYAPCQKGKGRQM
jgi:hypothetical protein